MRRELLIVGTLVAACGCGTVKKIMTLGYTSKSLSPQNVRTVHLPVFENRTFRRGLEFQLTAAIKNELLHKSDLRIADRDVADTELTGEIVDVREHVLLELQDLRDHGVASLYSYLGIRYKKQGDEVVTSYDELEEGLALLRRFGFDGTVVVRTGFAELARLLGHKDMGRHAEGQPVEDERFVELAVQALRGLAPLKAKYADLRLVVTHMDEVLGRKRLPLYISLTKPVQQVPSERMYITLHTLPRPWVPDATKLLDPYVDVRCYNGHALDLWIQAGHTFDELKRELERSGDDGWVYYNPHRPFFIAKWARIVNGLFMWWSPLKVHCPYRYRTMRGYPYSFIHNMGFSVRSVQDLKTPIATRQWEGFRLGAQDVWYICMLEDLVTRAKDSAPALAAAEWLKHLHSLMPKAEEIQGIDNESPVVLKVAERLDGAAYEKLRLTTAEHIIRIGQGL